jgi:hypothetical protein
MDKAQSILMSARPLIVPGHHFLHRHRGQPLSFTVPVLYTIKPELSMTFLLKVVTNFLTNLVPVVTIL